MSIISAVSLFNARLKLCTLCIQQQKQQQELEEQEQQQETVQETPTED